MSKDIERYLDQAVPVRRETLADRFPQPSPLTRAGQVDRLHEGRHLVAMRDVARRMELQAAETFAKLQSEMQTMEADDMLLTEVKLRLQRQKKLSQILGEDDPELRAAYSVLDDDSFHRRRASLMFGIDD